jgi:hypothetical protein
VVGAGVHVRGSPPDLGRALRLAWVLRHPKELLERLEAAQAFTVAPQDTAQPTLPVAVAVGEIADVSLARLCQYAAAYRGFERAWAEAERYLPDTQWSPTQRMLVWLVGGLNVLAAAEVEADLLLTHGIGATAARVAQGETKLASALDATTRAPGSTDPPDAARLSTALAATHTIVDLAPGSALSVMFDLSGWTDREGRQELLDRLEALLAEPLSPYGNPATRYQLVMVRFADAVRQVLLITLHSLFADAWSGHLIWEQLRSGDDNVPVSQRDWFDHVRDQQQGAVETAASLTSFWTGYLAGSRYRPLPTDQ